MPRTPGVPRKGRRRRLHGYNLIRIKGLVVNNDKNQTFDISYIACDELQPEAKTISEIKFSSCSTTFFKYGRVKDAKRNILLQNEETITTPFAKAESFYNYTEYGIELLTKSTDGKETLKLVDQNISRAVNVTSPTDILKWKKQQQNKE